MEVLGCGSCVTCSPVSSSSFVKSMIESMLGKNEENEENDDCDDCDDNDV